VRGRDLADFLAEVGAVVGGSAALGATLGFVAGTLLHDLDANVDPEFWARRCGYFGGLFGLAALLLGAVE
jgi:hypothetical protein